MPTDYPSSIDGFSNPSSSSRLNSPSHSTQHANLNDAVEAIETELGTDPAGTEATVSDRLDGVDLGKVARTSTVPSTLPLIYLEKALAASRTTAQDIICIGDSNTHDGQPAGYRSWVHYYAERLSARFGTRPYGVGWIPVYQYDVNVGTLAWDSPGGAAITTGPGNYGRTYTVGQTGYNTEVCTSIGVLYGSGSGTLRLLVDDVQVTTINTAAVTGWGHVEWITGLTDAAHKITVEAVGGTVNVAGAFFGSDDPFRLFNFGHGGLGIDDLIAATGTIETIENVAPAAVFITAGLNDRVLDSITAAQLKTRLQSLFAAIQAASPETTIIYAFEQEIGAGIPDWGTDYRASAREACDEYGVVLVDMWAWLGIIADTPFSLPDNIHLTEDGCRRLAKLMWEATVGADSDDVPALKVDGSRALTGSLDVGGFNLTDVGAITFDTATSTGGHALFEADNGRIFIGEAEGTPTGYVALGLYGPDDVLTDPRLSITSFEFGGAWYFLNAKSSSGATTRQLGLGTDTNWSFFTHRVRGIANAEADDDAMNRGQARLGDIAVTVSSAGTLTLSTGGCYVFSGTTSTWTLPALSASSNRRFLIKNRGSGNLTVERAGSDQLYSTSAVTSITVAAGSAVTLVNDGTYWVTL